MNKCRAHHIAARCGYVARCCQLSGRRDVAVCIHIARNLHIAVERDGAFYSDVAGRANAHAVAVCLDGRVTNGNGQNVFGAVIRDARVVRENDRALVDCALRRCHLASVDAPKDEPILQTVRQEKAKYVLPDIRHGVILVRKRVSMQNGEFCADNPVVIVEHNARRSLFGVHAGHLAEADDGSELCCECVVCKFQHLKAP